YARHKATMTIWSGALLSSGRFRVTRTDSTFDSYGMLTQVDQQGDVDVSDDEECTKTTYVRNTALNLLTPVARVETYALRCGVNPASEADVVSDARNSYDGLAYGATPTKADVTKVEIASSWASPAGSVWLTTSTASYDGYGRSVDNADVRGNHATTV